MKRLKLVLMIFVPLLTGCNVDQIYWPEEGDGSGSVVTTYMVVPANTTISLSRNSQGVCQATQHFMVQDNHGNVVTASSWRASGGSISNGDFATTAVGTYSIYATVNGKEYKTEITVNGECGNTNPGTYTISYVPSGGSYSLGSSPITLTATCYLNGSAVECPSSVSWTSSTDAVSISPNGKTATLTFVRVGASDVCARLTGNYTYASACHTFSVTNTTNNQPPTLTPTLNLYPPNCPNSGSYVGYVNVTNGQTVNFTSSNTGIVTVVTSNGSNTEVRAVSAGEAYIYGNNANGQGSSRVVVNACPNNPGTATGVKLRPKFQQCKKGQEVTVYGEVEGNPSDTSILFDITSGSNRARLVTAGPNTARVLCDDTGRVIVRGRANTNLSLFDTAEVEVYEENLNLCSGLTFDYNTSPSSTTGNKNEKRVLTSVRPSSWPSGCRIGWETDKGLSFTVESDAPLPAAGGGTFQVGWSADLTFREDGEGNVTAFLIYLRPDGKWERAGISVTKKYRSNG